MDCQNLFDQYYINKNQYEQLEQMIKFEIEQQLQIEKMVKALNDFFNAAEIISLQYQNQASTRCIWEICKRLYRIINKKTF